jgi:PD-(D/E)XK nuclease superfamily
MEPSSGLTRPTDVDFGRYLEAVAERDVDLLLMEEFHVNDDFVAWFCTEIGVEGASPAGAWHSLSDTDGESDLLLRVIRSDRRIGVLIENKISAPEQDNQAERYHLRGIKSREQGKLDDYVTVMCAPSRYLETLSATSVYQHRVSYEKIAAWFGAQPGRRAAWRHHIMIEAIDQGRRGYTMTVNATNTAFHLSYWEYVQRQHPRIHMARPINRGSKSNWIIMKGYDFPKGVNMHHKLDQRVLEIGFSGRSIEDLMSVKSDWPDDIAPVQKGRTASLAMRVPAIDMKLGFATQLPAVEAALAAAYRLMPFASLLQSPRP